MAQDTCKREECLQWQVFDGKCPNYYLTTYFKQGAADAPYQVHDCAPIRTMLLLQEMYVMLLSLQQANEQQRNKSTIAVDLFSQMVKRLQEKHALKQDEVIPLPG